MYCSPKPTAFVPHCGTDIWVFWLHEVVSSVLWGPARSAWRRVSVVSPVVVDVDGEDVALDIAAPL